MTINWTPTTLVHVDEVGDRERADRPGGSRFGSYLAARTDSLWEEDRTDRVAFTIWAWGIATPPVMSPGYVYLRPDLQAVRLVRAEDDGALVVEVGVPLPRTALAREVRPPYDVADWHAAWSGEDYRMQWPPSDEKRPAVLLSALLREPGHDWDLYAPRGAEDQLVDDAQQAVQTVARLINQRLGPRVADLLGEGR